ncbi:PIN domain-containing protein [bacterium]|nr:PIN domain-containing protein [bacterium]
MILIDTSVWISFLAGCETLQTKTMEALIERREDICICGLVMTELLQGIRNSEQYEKTKVILSELLYLPMTRDIFIDAANIYRVCRSQGLTIRSPIDCMIAAICIAHGAKLLHNDRDFVLISEQFPLNSL